MKTINTIRLEEIKKSYSKKFEVTIIQRGAEGGNCWGSDAEYFENDCYFEGIEHFKKQDQMFKMKYCHYDAFLLDKLLNELVPNLNEKKISLIYKKLDKYVKQEEFSTYEYYGNYSEGFIAILKLENIIEALEECQLI